MDEDKDGKISEDDLKEFFHCSSNMENSKFFKEIINEVDTKNKRDINLKKFTKILDISNQSEQFDYF